MVIPVSSQLRPELPKHASVCWLLLPPLSGIWRRPDLSPTKTLLSLWDPFKPHQKVHPKNPHNIPAVRIQQPPGFLKSNHCLFMPLENVFFNGGGTLKPEESQPKRHLEATKIKIPKISLLSSESSL